MEIENKQYDLDGAFDYCAEVTKSHYENFPVASLFLPEEKRPYIQAVYAFSRIADDYADENGLNKEDRLAKLNDWEEKLKQCYDSHPEHPVFVALQETVKRLEIPIDPLRDLLIAFRRDVTQNRYETFDDLLGYCRCSANPVGKLVLMIFGYRDEKLFELSDKICTALQLANFWQDVSVDKNKDRLYIPLEDLEHYEYSLDDWNDGKMNENFAILMKYEVERSKELFYSGAELPSLVTKDLQLELKLIWFGGMAILGKIGMNRYDVIRRRPRLTMLDKTLILSRGLVFNDLQHYKRKRPKKEPWDLT